MTGIPFGLRHYGTDHRLFPILDELLVLAQAMATAILYLAHGRADLPPGSVLAAESARLGAEVCLPIHGPLQSRIAGWTPAGIQIRIQPISAAERQLRFVPVQNEMVALATPFFTSFYEDHCAWVQANVCGDKSKWPAPWGFARVVRNALSHGGCVHIDNARAPVVEWRGLQYGPDDNGKRIIGTDLHIGDVVLLLLDLDYDLTRRGCPFPLP